MTCISTPRSQCNNIEYLQLCVFAGKGNPGRILVAHNCSGSFDAIGSFLGGGFTTSGIILRPICAGADLVGDLLKMLIANNIR